MAESVSVRCPVCCREHSYAPPSFPCACGAPVTLPLLRGGIPVAVEHRTWAGSWVPVRCGACGREDEWPQPEFGCACGTTVRMPVVPAPPAPPTGAAGAPARGDARTAPAERGGAGTLRQPQGRTGGAPVRRPAFRPVTIRTGQDARTAAAQYLRWLGFTEVRIAGNRPASGVDLRSPEIIAHVDPTTTPTALRDIETLWLNGLNESAAPVCFSLAGYSQDARNRADALGVPLFVLDLTGTPQPVNDAADDLIRSTA